jgi:hypothetical protein
MTFAKFIQSKNITNSPRGDFIADTKTLINASVFPVVESWGDLYRFMIRRRACPEAIEEARKLWRAYKSEVSEAA